MGKKYASGCRLHHHVLQNQAFHGFKVVKNPKLRIDLLNEIVHASIKMLGCKDCFLSEKVLKVEYEVGEGCKIVVLPVITTL